MKWSDRTTLCYTTVHGDQVERARRMSRSGSGRVHARASTSRSKGTGGPLVHGWRDQRLYSFIHSRPERVWRHARSGGGVLLKPAPPLAHLGARHTRTQPHTTISHVTDSSLSS